MIVSILVSVKKAVGTEEIRPMAMCVDRHDTSVANPAQARAGQPVHLVPEVPKRSEARAAGTHVTWAPVLGLCREPRWGRCEEMMGEDTHLAAELGRAAIGGFTNGNQFNSSAAVAPPCSAAVAPTRCHDLAPRPSPVGRTMSSLEHC